MKLSNYLFISIATILLSSINLINSAQNNYFITPLIKTAKAYSSFANLPYCNLEVINSLSCPLCSSILDASFKVVSTHTNKINENKFTFVILRSIPKKEVVISFAGPRSTETEFFQSIYIGGFKKFKKTEIEKTFLESYKSFDKELKLKLNDLLKEKDFEINENKFIFVGHSVGGSLAVLSAFDLVSGKIIPTNKELNSPLVYSYGQLRIGNMDFVDKVNSLFKLIRIVKNTDFMTQLPNCIFQQSTGKWKCFNDPSEASKQIPEYHDYIMHANGSGANAKVTSGVQVAYGARPSSFLERSSSRRSRKSKSFYFGSNNSGQAVPVSYAHGLRYGISEVNSLDQPIGQEVIFGKTFKKWHICNYFKGIPNCLNMLPKSLGLDDHTNYYENDLEQC